MSGTHELMQTRGAGFSLVGRDKHTPEDRWALAELDGFVIGAVADGISDPLGSGLTGGRLAPSGSGAVADEAVGAFVERASRLVEGGEQDARVIVREAFVAAELAARTLAGALRSGVGGGAGSAVGVEGGAAFVGACLDAQGTLAVIKVGDCRALVPVGQAWRPVTPSDDADRQGALTAFLGASQVEAEVVVHRDIERAVLLSDGGWRAGLPAAGGLSQGPFALVRDLVARARRAGETDDLTALVLMRTARAARAGALAGVFDRLAPLTFVVAGALFFAAGLVAATLLGGGP